MARGVHAVAPEEHLLLFDLILDLEEPLEERLRARRAAGDVDVDGDDLVDPLAHRVRVAEEAAAVGAAPHRDDVAGLGHLLVETAHAEGHLVREGARDDHEVALARARAGGAAEALEVGARAAGLHQLDGAAREAEEEVPDAVGTAPVEEPVDHVVDPGGEDAAVVVRVAIVEACEGERRRAILERAGFASLMGAPRARPRASDLADGSEAPAGRAPRRRCGSTRGPPSSRRTRARGGGRR